ncbi:MAG: DUF4160 domain-containing protein [Clostridia bacterium]|jgi:hypothetical protein|nr:DUF4160 domain-containing protein [Clostridia bacterium]
MTPISLFYGIIIYMYTDKSTERKVPHIHAVFKEEEVVMSLAGDVLDGYLNPGKLALVRAWLVIHQDDLTANWRLMLNGNEVFRIDPLR